GLNRSQRSMGGPDLSTRLPRAKARKLDRQWPCPSTSHIAGPSKRSNSSWTGRAGPPAASNSSQLRRDSLGADIPQPTCWGAPTPAYRHGAEGRHRKSEIEKCATETRRQGPPETPSWRRLMRLTDRPTLSDFTSASSSSLVGCPA